VNITSRTIAAIAVGAAAVLAIAAAPSAAPTAADGQVLKFRAAYVGATAMNASLTIELFRWSTDAERAPLLAALSAPSSAPSSAQSSAQSSAPSAPVTPAAGRGGRAGRGGGRENAAPPSPLARLTAAVKAAPTVGFIWRDGPTGYSIKYAWRSASPDRRERIILATDRQLDSPPASSGPAPGTAAGAEFTVVEMWVDGKGVGEAKTSLASPVVVDTAAGTLALGGYADAPALLKVTR